MLRQFFLHSYRGTSGLKPDFRLCRFNFTVELPDTQTRSEVTAPCKNRPCRYRISYHENNYQNKVSYPRVFLKNWILPGAYSGFCAAKLLTPHWIKRDIIFIHVINVVYCQYLSVLLFFFFFFPTCWIFIYLFTYLFIYSLTALVIMTNSQTLREHTL